MRAETQRLFREVLHKNWSAMELLSGDYTMLNEALAKHYGLKGILGRKFRRVSFPADQHRGGLLGHASILLSNSTGEDSHAVRRAVWIRDRLLNDPPAPPPPDVPSLDEAGPDFLKLPVREQLRIHRSTDACATCHRNIDPLGIALENFDAVGLWREQVRRKVGGKFETQPVDASDVLPGDIELGGIESLKDYLVTQRKDDFSRALVTRILTYALGRRLELSDEEAIDDLTEKFAADGFKLQRLIHSIVRNERFQTK